MLTPNESHRLKQRLNLFPKAWSFMRRPCAGDTGSVSQGVDYLLRTAPAMLWAMQKLSHADYFLAEHRHVVWTVVVGSGSTPSKLVCTDPAGNYLYALDSLIVDPALDGVALIKRRCSSGRREYLLPSEC